MLLYFYAFIAVACAQATWGPPNFSRWIWGSSVVVGDWLYLDAGEVYNLSSDPTPMRYMHQLGSTIAIDLTKSWSNTSLFTDNTAWYALDKPSDYLFSRAPWLWAQGSTLNAWGGWGYIYSLYSSTGGLDQQGTSNSNYTWLAAAQTISVDNNSANINSVISPTLWQTELPLQDSNGATWAIASQQLPANIGYGFGYLTASSNNSAFALGGCSPSKVFQIAEAFPGMAVQDSADGAWANISSAAYGAGGFGAFGEAVYVPDYGSQGLLVFLGGYTPTSQTFDWGVSTLDPLQAMDRIGLYDIASGTFTFQPATGAVPGRRWRFCAVGATDSSGKGFDIFVHGGFPGGEFPSPSTAYDEDYANVFVLSLPSFTWSRVPNSAAAEMRSQHTCQVIGKSQMAVLGGHDPTTTTYGITKDPNENAIGIWDMNNLQWAIGYDSGAAAYTRPSSITGSIGSNNYPATWQSQFVQSLFMSTSSSGTVSSSSVFKTTSPPGAATSDAPLQNSATATSSNTAAIVGSVVGGVAGLALLIALIAYLLRRKRSSSAPSQSPWDSSSEKYNGNSLGTGTGWYSSSKDVPAHLQSPVELEAAHTTHELSSERNSYKPRWLIHGAPVGE